MCGKNQLLNTLSTVKPRAQASRNQKNCQKIGRGVKGRADPFGKYNNRKVYEDWGESFLPLFLFGFHQGAWDEQPTGNRSQPERTNITVGGVAGDPRKGCKKKASENRQKKNSKREGKRAPPSLRNVGGWGESQGKRQRRGTAKKTV